MSTNRNSGTKHPITGSPFKFMPQEYQRDTFRREESQEHFWQMIKSTDLGVDKPLHSAFIDVWANSFNTQKIFIQYLLCVRHCSGCWGQENFFKKRTTNKKDKKSVHVNYLTSLTLRFLFHKLGIIVPPFKAFVKIQ